MKNIGIIIHSRPAYDMQWDALLPNDTSNNALILIATANSIEKLTKRDKKAFIAIYESENFDYDHLKALFNTIHQTFYCKGDKTKVSTVAEYDMIVTAMLRDHFREPLSIDGPGLNAILPFRDKLQMKAALVNKGIRMPRYVKFDRSLFITNTTLYIKNLEEHLQFPMFAKPIDGAASLGTTLIKNKKQLVRWCEDKLPLAQDFELDEYIDGTLFHCDSIVQNGHIVFTFVSQYLHPNADAQKGLPLATMTLDLAHPNYQNLKAFAEKTLRQFPNLPDGCTHLEVFLSKGQELLFLEVAARPPGSQAPEMYKHRTNGIDIRAIHTKLNLGFKIDEEIVHLLDATKWGAYASMWDLVRPNKACIIEKLQLPVLHSNYHITWKYKAQDTIAKGVYNADLIASIVFWHSNYSLLTHDFQHLDSQHLVTMKPNLKTPSELINPNLLPGPNPLKPLGCTTISYPTFFNKRNVGIGAVALLSQLTKTEANAHSPLLCTDVNPYLLFALIVGSGLFVAILLRCVWEIMPVENKARNPTA